MNYLFLPTSIELHLTIINEDEFPERIYIYNNSVQYTVVNQYNLHTISTAFEKG